MKELFIFEIEVLALCLFATAHANGGVVTLITRSSPHLPDIHDWGFCSPIFQFGNIVAVAADCMSVCSQFA